MESQRARFNLKRLNWLPRLYQAPPQAFIDHGFHGPTGLAHLRLELGGYIVIESDGSSHIMMLAVRHHDVKKLR
jgi:hypothetical protein